MKIIIALSAVAICFTGIHFCPGEDAAQQTKRPLMTLTGADSHVKERSYHRITSETEWIKIWQRHKGVKESKDYDLYYNPLDLPYIDFEQCMVIAVFQGNGWNSAGLKADGILEENDDIVIRFDDKSYHTMGPNGGGEKVTVYGFFVLPRSGKTMILEENHQNLLGQPPVWKTVGTLKSAVAAELSGSTESTKSTNAEQPEAVVVGYLEKIKSVLPKGRFIKSEKNIITVKRDTPIEWYGTISLPSLNLAKRKAQGFVQSGNYTIILEFFPPMSKAEVEKLTKENERIEEKYYRQHPQPKNSKPLGLPNEVRESLHHIPNILAKNYSVLLTPFIQGPGVAFFNDEEQKECEGVKQAVTRLLNSDK